MTDLILLFAKVIEKSNEIIVLLGASLLIRFILELCGQRWVKTIAHTSTLTILPIITFIITRVIAGNIALSLGMVGALSIVRFRNPVRSPLELSVYFAAITMGITASVNLKFLYFFLYSIICSVLILFVISMVFEKVLKRKFFVTSFSEGNSLSTLDVSVLKNIDILENSPLLKSKIVSEDRRSYLMASENFEALRQIVSKLDDDENIIEYQLNE